ncbi:hypothetical protein EBAPG3_011795 [Nitrosospira lacus]|uniref:Uncharacterized protein n=1 Tax=Nitrosospira lacus TaxID=1288494 RepID=A0A1W6SRF6_9PROT|nr:hypothetical protein EBAPG3_011795 [Nitrosospira lacus]
MVMTEAFINRPSLRGLRGMVLCLGIWLPATVFASSPSLRCEINQNGETHIADFPPNANPYTVESKDINGRFRRRNELRLKAMKKPHRTGILV